MKKFQKVQYAVLGMIIMVILGTAVVPVMAAMVQKQITVSTGVNIYVDDVKLNPADANGNPVEVFTYNGTTYLPARAVSTAVGKPVSWDGKTQSVYIGKHDSGEPTVMLNDLDYFDSSENVYGENALEKGTVIKDNLGNTYYDVLAAEKVYSSAWKTYKINGMYSKMKGRVIVPYDYRSTDEVSQVKIYCDDKLAYTSPEMTGGVEPVDFSVDLTGVLSLKVEITDNAGPGLKTAFAALVDTRIYQ